MAKNKVLLLSEFDADYVMGRSWLVGIDEAGRGALAGPVCAGAAAVSASLYKNEKYLSALADLNDSKQLSAPAREKIYDTLCALKNAGVLDFEAAYASVEEIEKYNILVATQMAMARACEILKERLNLNLRKAGTVSTLFGERGLDTSNAEVLIDGKPMKKFPYSHKAVVKGDASSLAIAAASIVAKVTRDKFMVELAVKYPRYEFEIHKGYGTASHLQALMLFGSSVVHRPSFLKKLRAESSRPTQTELF